MKKIFTCSILATLILVVFAGCAKEKIYDDHSSWLSQERGEVVYSSNSCGFYVVHTDYGYTIIQNLDGLRTYSTDVMYGDFGGYGKRNFYNFTADVITRGNIVEYDLGYYEAQDAIDYYCPFGKSQGLKITQNDPASVKTPETAIREKK
jgi:hypothetical protein